MAQMHPTVVSANNEVIPRRVDENFGLSTSVVPSLTLSTSGIADLNSVAVSATAYVVNSTAAVTLNGFTGGCIGQKVSVKATTSAIVTIHSSTGGTGHNIYLNRGDDIRLNVTGNNKDVVTFLKNTSAVWTSHSDAARIKNMGANTALTISTGEITITGSWHYVLAETGSDDNLESILGGSNGDRLFLRSYGTTNTITLISHSTMGTPMYLSSNTALSENDVAGFIHDGGGWRCTGISHNSTA